MIITINDIAREAKVSITTVSRYLNNPIKVKESTRERIQKVIEKYNYTPNALARGLVTQETKSVGVIIPDINNLFYPSLLRGIEEGIKKDNYSLFLCNTDRDIKKEILYFNTLKEKRVDGIIVLGTRVMDDRYNQHIKEYSKTNHVVLVNDYIEESNAYSIMTDEVYGAYIATKYLIELGHKKILHISGEEYYSTYENKKRGYIKAMKESRLDIEVMHNDEYIYQELNLVKKIFENIKLPTAILCASDQIALAVSSAMMSEGLSIPKDISIIGYANVPIMSVVYPPITTVDQFPYKTGYMAGELMTNLFNGIIPQNRKKIFKPKLLKRDSCRSIK